VINVERAPVQARSWTLDLNLSERIRRGVLKPLQKPAWDVHSDAVCKRQNYRVISCAVARRQDFRSIGFPFVCAGDGGIDLHWRNIT